MKEVLIIEDNDDSAEMLGMLLEFQGFTVLRAKTGREGIRLASSRCPNLIITDLGLPDMPGIEVIREISSLAMRHSLIVALTGRDESGVRIDAKNAGADHFFLKGEEIGNLLARLDQAS